MTENTDLDQAVAAMLAPSTERMSTVRAALPGAGADAAASFARLTEFTDGMVQIGAATARTITELRGKQELPRDFRLTKENEARDVGRMTLEKFRQGAYSAANELESALVNASLPAPSKDTSTRLLHRDEVRTRYGGLSGEALVKAVQTNLGRHEHHDAELLSSFGSAMLEAAGATKEQLAAVREQGVSKYLERSTGGSRQQQAARNALKTYRSVNVAGSVAGFHAVGRLHLRSVGG